MAHPLRKRKVLPMTALPPRHSDEELTDLKVKGAVL